MARVTPIALLALTIVIGAACTEGRLDLRRPAPDVGDGKDGPWNVSVPTARVNTCHRLVFGSGTQLELLETTGIFPGRRLFVWQMQDSFAVSGSPAAVEDAERAGRWTFATAASVVGTTVELTATLPNVFATDSDGSAQVCTVPEFTRVTVTSGGEIDARPFDGDVYGVVIFFAERLEVAGRIDAGHNGFRGGVSPLGGGATTTDEDTSAASGAGKGEGLDSRSFGLFGRGNLANGGGGGNTVNAGGGGGGNGGRGGRGAIECCGSNPETYGRPGSEVTQPTEIFLAFGGGGGGGQANEAIGARGGDGGGLVVLVVGTFLGAGLVYASGDDGGSIGLPLPAEGAGGGGAGGTIWIRAGRSTFTGLLRARGGDGGDVLDGSADPDVHGPGGGGGGGRVELGGVPAATTDVEGGLQGLNEADARGATDGMSGVVIVD